MNKNTNELKKREILEKARDTVESLQANWNSLTLYCDNCDNDADYTNDEATINFCRDCAIKFELKEYLDKGKLTLKEIEDFLDE